VAATHGTKRGGTKEGRGAKITLICITKNMWLILNNQGAQSGNLAQGTRNHGSASFSKITWCDYKKRKCAKKGEKSEKWRKKSYIRVSISVIVKTTVWVIC